MRRRKKRIYREYHPSQQEDCFIVRGHRRILIISEMASAVNSCCIAILQGCQQNLQSPTPKREISDLEVIFRQYGTVGFLFAQPLRALVGYVQMLFACLGLGLRKQSDVILYALKIFRQNMPK